MKLSLLIDNAPDIEISQVTDDAREVTQGALFIARDGSTKSGADYALEAVKRGAVAVLSDRELSLPVFSCVASSVNAEMGRIADKFYMRHEGAMKIVAVVGTNGKTTTTRLLYELVSMLGKRCGVIGTLGAEWNGKSVNTGLTTPGRIALSKILGEMERDCVEYVFIEVSAHAIAQGRLQGIRVDLAIFTNLTQDHLDYFTNMEEYAEVKAGFFNSRYIGCAVVNVDDTVGRGIAVRCDVPVITYGLETPCDVFAIDVTDGKTLDFFVNAMDEVFSYRLSLHGRFNVYNMLGVISATKALGFSGREVCLAARRLSPVPGRYQVIDTPNGRVIIDYAHTPDALKNVLTAVKAEGRGLITCVFGCGGDRDRGKRPIMGAIAEAHCDRVIVTSDNPRWEAPETIIADVCRGIKGKKEVIIDRKEAIRHALNDLSGGTLVIAGKGAEEYIEACGERVPFSDETVVREWLKEGCLK